MITLAGSNSYALEADLRQLIDDFVKEYGELALQKIDAEETEYDKITEAIQSLPFLSSKKLVILNRPGTQKQFVENIERFTESISDSTDVVIVEPKPDKRSSYYKFLQKKTDFRNFDELGPRELPGWLTQEAKARGGSLSLRDAQYLMDRVGPNQQLLTSELDKLLLYDSSITSKTIELLTEVAPQGTIFQLLDACFAGKLKQAMELYHEQRALKVEPVQIVAMLTWQLYSVAVVKTAGDKPVSTVASESGLSPFVVQKSQTIARKLTLNQIKQLIHSLQELDIKTKTTSVDPDEALQHYLVSLAVSGAIFY